MSGTLYIVATPIGNLEDITLRALRILQEVDLVACEDTRQTARLLTHYQIRKPATSYHEHNETEKSRYLLELLTEGKTIALVSDAGTPCISDPGYRIVRRALENGIQVVPIPGPCSFIAALSASGRPTDAFTFLGFLPARGGARRTLLESLRTDSRTLIFFESPTRLRECLGDLLKILGDRPVTIGRELTKLYEELYSGAVSGALAHFGVRSVKGELVLIVAKGEKPVQDLNSLDPIDLKRRVEEYMRTGNLAKNEAIKRLAQELNVPKRNLYALLLEKR